MKIRDEQMYVFQRAAEEAFVERVASYLRERYPQIVEELPEDELRRRVRLAIAKGRSYDLTWQSALTGFVVLMFTVAPNFDLHPAFREALKLRLQDENDRIRAIHQSVTDADWSEAQQHYDETAWYPQPGNEQ